MRTTFTFIVAELHYNEENKTSKRITVISVRTIKSFSMCANLHTVISYHTICFERVFYYNGKIKGLLLYYHTNTLHKSRFRRDLITSIAFSVGALDSVTDRFF